LTSSKKIAVVGAGNWGINLVRNFRDLGVLTHVADPEAKHRDRAAMEAPDAQLLDDYYPLLDSDVDAVAISTPAPTHFEIAKAFLGAGKDVFVEKPMTMTSAEAEDLVKTADANSLILMVGHLLLYQPAIQFLKKYIDEGKLGKIYHLHQERLKLGRARYVENVTWSLGVHDIAVLLFLAGSSPCYAYASGHCGLQKSVEDDVYVHMEFLNGTKAHLHISWLWPENRRGLKVIGEKGMLVHDEIARTVTLHRKTIDSDLNHHDDGEELIFQTDDAQPLLCELAHFVHCLTTRTPPISNGRNGVAVISVLERVMMF
jgi:predicted dehydrogenase